MKNNPYIELVQNDNNILHIPEEIYPLKGNWAEYFKNKNPLILEVGTGMGNFF
jgi:tRNA G46 methylase TrmB